MGNEIIPFADLGIVPANDKIFTEISSQSFLPRIMLMQAGSESVKTDKIKQGHFALVLDKESPMDLGDVFDALVLTWRPKAIRIEGNEIVEDLYDFEDPSYKKIMEDSETRVDGMSALFGPEFLCYVPQQKKYATFFFSNKTTRREAPVVKGLLGKIVTFKRKIIKSGARSWFGITTFESTTPLAETPDINEMKDIVKGFQSPSSRKKEAAPVDGQRER